MRDFREETAFVEASALEWVNKVRVRYSLSPLARFPEGKRCDAERCPAANALAPIFGHAIVGLTRISLRGFPGSSWVELAVPPQVSQYITLFDSGVIGPQS